MNKSVFFEMGKKDRFIHWKIIIKYCFGEKKEKEFFAGLSFFWKNNVFHPTQPNKVTMNIGPEFEIYTLFWYL